MLICRVVLGPGQEEPRICVSVVHDQTSLDQYLEKTFYKGWVTPDNQKRFHTDFRNGEPLFLIMDYHPETFPDASAPPDGQFNIHLTSCRNLDTLRHLDLKHIYPAVLRHFQEMAESQEF